VFALIYEQCHKTLQSKLKARANYDTEIKGDPINMLQVIQEHTMSYQENLYNAKIVTNAIRNTMYTKQRDDEDLVDYTRHFKTAKDFWKHSWEASKRSTRWQRKMKNGMRQMQQR
jgi:hypothetical protein